MDSPDKPRRHQATDDPFLISLTDEERLHGLDLFGDEPSSGEPQPLAEASVYERVPAYADTVDLLKLVAREKPSALPEPRRKAPTPPESWNSPLWYAPALATVLIAVIVAYAVLTVRVMRAPADTTVSTPSERSSEPNQTARIVPETPAAAVATSPVAVAAIPFGETEERSEGAAPVSAEPPVGRAAARTEGAVAVRPETAAVRDSPVQAAPVSLPRPADSQQAVVQPLPGSPTPQPASLSVEPQTVDVVAAVLSRPEVPAAPAPLRAAPEAAIQMVLGQYRTAYRELDAGAARAVWPSVDTRALRKAFDSLEQQDLVFDSCQIAVADARAVASCRGFAWYIPRVGNKSPHDDQREWEFTLRKSGEAWLIDTVSAR